MAQLMTVTVGPLATADADGVSLSQTAAGAQYLVINGALAAGTFAATSICAAQAAGGAGALTINGTLAQTNNPAGAGGTYQTAPSAYVQFPTPVRVYITNAGDDSGDTFTITGTIQTPGTFGPGIVVSETVTGANANTVASSKLYSRITSISTSGASAGNVSVGHSGVGTMDMARRVSITSGGNDTGIAFTLVGTDWNGDPITETVTGASGAAATSVLSYLTVTSILTSGAVATTVQVGSSAVADSPPIYFDRLAANAQTALQVEGSGTVNWTVRQTLDDPTIISNQHPTPTYIWSPSGIVWVDHPDSALVAKTTTTGVQGNYAYTPAMAKIVLNSGTGSVRLTAIQAFMGG